MFRRENIKKTEVKLPADLKYSKLVREFATEYLMNVGVPKMEVNRLILVLDELWMNAVRYGSDEGSFVKVSFLENEEGVEISVEDEGVGRKKIKAKEMKKLIEENIEKMHHKQVSGRGIALIVNKWTDGWEIEDSRMGGIKISIVRLAENFAGKEEENVVIEEEVEAKKEMSRPPKKDLDYKSLPIRKVKMSGYITQENLPEYADKMHALIENGGVGLIILDFEELVYINSLFIGAMSGWAQLVEEQGGDMVVVNMQENVRDVVDLCGLWQIISFYDTIESVKKDLDINF